MIRLNSLKEDSTSEIEYILFTATARWWKEENLKEKEKKLKLLDEYGPHLLMMRANEKFLF